MMTWLTVVLLVYNSDPGPVEKGHEVLERPV